MLPRIGYGLFALGAFLIAAMSLFFVSVGPLSQTMPHMAHYLPNLPLPLWAHLLAGPVALSLAPFQLWTGLRTRRPVLHRLMDYGYATAGLGALILLSGQGGVAELLQAPALAHDL